MLIKRTVLRDYRTLLVLAVPLTAGSLSGILTGLVDTAFLGRYGDVTETLAGAAIAIQISLGITIVTVASMIGQTVLSAHSFGANHPHRVGVVMWHSALLFLPFSIVVGATLNLGAEQIAGIFTDSEPVIGIAASYFRVSAFTIPVFVAHFLIANVLTADRKVLYVFLGSFAVGVVNVSLSYPLIYGLGPIPELGVPGSALASLLAELAAFALLAGIFIYKRYPQTIRPSTFKVSPRFLGSLIMLSVPTMLSVLFLQVGEFNVLRVAGLAGNETVATVRVVNIVMFSTFALMFGFSQAGQVLSGRLLGAGDWQSVKRMYRRNWELLLFTYVPLGIVYVSIPTLIMGIITNEMTIIDIGTTPFRVGALTMLIVTWTLNSVSFIRGIGKTPWDLMMNGVSALLVQIPLAYLFTLTFGWGIIGLYVSTLLFWLVRGIIGFSFLMSVFRRDHYEMKSATTLTDIFVND